MKKISLTFLVLIITSISLFAQDASILFERKPYYIQSALNYGKNNGGYWDIPGHPQKVTKGMNVQVWELDTDKDRKFYMFPSDKEGYYEICPGWSTKVRLDISGGKPNMKKNGANIAAWTKNDADWQKFRFKHLGNGKFRIYTTSGMALCLNNRNSKNGSNVHIWADHEGPWMDWYLIDTETKKPFIPKTLKPFDLSKPDFFIRNKDKIFKFRSDLAFGSGSKGTAKVLSINGDKIKLHIESTGTDMQTGKPRKNSYDYELNYKNDGFYWHGDWNVPENSRGKSKIYPDGKMTLDLSGEQHVITFTIEAE